MTFDDPGALLRGLANIFRAPRPSRDRPAGRRGRVPWPPALKRLNGVAVLFLVVAAVSAIGLHWPHRSGGLEGLATSVEVEIYRLIPWNGLAVGEIVVTGRHHATEADIAAALGVRKGEPLFDVDPRKVRERIEALGWVRSASVRRRFPDAILVNIVERRPFALWQRQGRVSLVDRDGEPIGSRDLDRFDRLPVVVGDDAPRHVGHLVAVLARQPALLGRIESATRVSRRRWDLQLRGGLTVRLPEEDLAGAWDFLATLATDHRLLERDVIAIDLRVKDRFAVTLGPASAVTHRGEGRST